MEKLILHPALSLEGSKNEFGEVSPAINRSSDLQACFDSYLPPLPSSLGASQCVCCGFRSCLPLRDSPGFSPGSLIDNACSLAHLLCRYTAGFQTLVSALLLPR